MSPCYTHYFVCIAPQWSWDDDVFFSAGLLIIVTTIFPQFSLIDGIQKIQREGSLHNTERTAKFFWQKESLKQWKQRAHLWLCFWKQTSLKTFFGEWRNQDVFFFQDRPPTYHSLTSTLRLSFWCQTLYFEFMRHLQTQTMQSRLIPHTPHAWLDKVNWKHSQSPKKITVFENLAKLSSRKLRENLL